MFISWPPSWIFWKIRKLLKIPQKLIKNIENVSILFKLSISMEKLEIKMHFKKFHVKKFSKVRFEKVVAMATA